MNSSTTITSSPNETHTFTTLLRADITRLEPQYAARLREHAALEPHPTLHDLVARMVDKKRNATRAQRRERGVLLSTLLHAYQASGHRLWETALLAACMPMVHTVRARFHGGDPDDRESVFLGDLARTLRTVDPDRDPQILRKVIWRKAKKRLVRRLAREHEWEETGFGVEADTLPDDEPLLACPEREAPEAASETTASEHATGRALARSARAATGRGALRELVARTCPHLSEAERAVVYRRLLKGRQRQAARLRKKPQLTVVRRRRVVTSSSAATDRNVHGAVECVSPGACAGGH